MGSIGPWEIIAVILLIIILFGAKKIPDLMHGIGKGIREFKKAVSGEDEKKENNAKKEEKTP